MRIDELMSSSMGEMPVIPLEVPFPQSDGRLPRPPAGAPSIVFPGVAADTLRLADPLAWLDENKRPGGGSPPAGFDPRFVPNSVRPSQIDPGLPKGTARIVLSTFF